jgi:AcrR family transcriptional regulator
MPAETGGARRGALKARARGASVSPRVQVAGMQRARLLAAAVVTVEELGWSGASVANIAGRARVSRRTFYDLFANREDCLLAVLQGAVERIEGEILAADLAGGPWRDRVREGLFVILSFLDREPMLARVCVVQALRGGPRVLQWREGVLARLSEILDRGRGEGSSSSRSQDCTALTAEGLVGAAFSIVYARLLTNTRREPLSGLLGELMSLIVLPYQGPAVARRERRGSGTFSSGRKSPAAVKGPVRSADFVVGDPFAGVPMRLTYRTARVLEVVAAHPGASNRLVAEHAGIADQGQVSKLLARLAGLELMHNTGEGHIRGERNAWRLTSRGGEIERALRVGPGDSEPRDNDKHKRTERPGRGIR